LSFDALEDRRLLSAATSLTALTGHVARPFVDFSHSSAMISGPAPVKASALKAVVSAIPQAPTVSTFFSTLNDPAGVAFDAAGNLYVANELSNTISKVTPAGAVTTFVSSGLSYPAGLAFDAAGNLYVANEGSNTISKVTVGRAEIFNQEMR